MARETDGSLHTTQTNKYIGYSTDAKPIIANYVYGTEVTFLELDTGIVYVWDGSIWVPL